MFFNYFYKKYVFYLLPANYTFIWSYKKAGRKLTDFSRHAQDLKETDNPEKEWSKCPLESGNSRRFVLVLQHIII